MPLKVEQQRSENSQTLVRRFVKSIKQSGILLQARKIRFQSREKSRQMKKRAALRRESRKIEYQRADKLGLHKKD